MRVSDKSKLKIIHFIDDIKPKLKRTVFIRDLNSLRSKYIYKDISGAELKKDIQFLKNIKKIIK